MSYSLNSNLVVNHPADIEHDAAHKGQLSDLLSMDAQAVYQIALAQLRLHRNRWKAPVSTEADPSHL
jgi:hypothetical protein